MMLPTPAPRLSALALLALACAAAPACGGSSSDSGSKYSLDTVCVAVTPQLCTDRQACCESASLGYDDAACKQHELDNCNANVAEVHAGTMTFDGSNIDTCLQYIKQYDAQCRLSLADIADVFSKLKPCQHIFTGQLAEGASCERDGQCMQSSDPNTSVGCDKTTKVCTWTRLLASGEACEIGAGAKPGFCGAGLYCDIAITQPQPFKGTCKTATPVGSACDTSVAFNLECALGNYCDATSGKCTTGKGDGEACTPGSGDLECASLKCDATSGKCIAPNPVVDSVDCNGA